MSEQCIERVGINQVDNAFREELCGVWVQSLMDSMPVSDALQIGSCVEGRRNVAAVRQQLGKRGMSLYVAREEQHKPMMAAAFIGRGSAAVHMLHPDSLRSRAGLRYDKWAREYELLGLDCAFASDDTDYNASILRQMIDRSVGERWPLDDKLMIQAWVSLTDARLESALEALDENMEAQNGKVVVQRLGAAGVGLPPVSVVRWKRSYLLELPQFDGKKTPQSVWQKDE